MSDAAGVKSPSGQSNNPQSSSSKSSFQVEPHSAVNATHPTEYWKHDNKFLNRKMMIYNVINQLSPEENSSNSTNNSGFLEPKRTFELFDMMKQIATAYCPDEFVNRDWIDLVIDLFYILHKGNIFKYDENLSEGDYKWIKGILSKCHARITENPEGENVVVLSSTPTVSDPTDEVCHSTGGGKVLSISTTDNCI